MSEYDAPERIQQGRATDDGLWTATSQAIAGFAISVVAMTGQGIWTQVLNALWGTFPQVQVPSVLSSWAVSALLVAGAGFVLSRRAVRTSPTDAWEAHLGRAGMIVAGLTCGLAMLTLVLWLARGALGYGL